MAYFASWNSSSLKPEVVVVLVDQVQVKHFPHKTTTLTADPRDNLIQLNCNSWSHS